MDPIPWYKKWSFWIPIALTLSLTGLLWIWKLGILDIGTTPGDVGSVITGSTALPDRLAKYSTEEAQIVSNLSSTQWELSDSLVDNLITTPIDIGWVADYSTVGQGKDYDTKKVGAYVVRADGVLLLDEWRSFLHGKTLYNWYRDVDMSRPLPWYGDKPPRSITSRWYEFNLTNYNPLSAPTVTKSITTAENRHSSIYRIDVSDWEYYTYIPSTLGAHGLMGPYPGREVNRPVGDNYDGKNVAHRRGIHFSGHIVALNADVTVKIGWQVAAGGDWYDKYETVSTPKVWQMVSSSSEYILRSRVIYVELTSPKEFYYLSGTFSQPLIQIHGNLDLHRDSKWGMNGERIHYGEQGPHNHSSPAKPDEGGSDGCVIS